MPLTFNLRHLEKGVLHLEGELAVEELDAELLDELVQLNRPVKYDFSVERLGANVLVRGKLEITLDCQCSRCLGEYQQLIVLDRWTLDLPLEGEEKVAVVNDCVDLTPFIREDTVLAFPQHPLCDTECSGLPYVAQTEPAKSKAPIGGGPSAWAELNKLKL
jgi:uncharacterized protein